MPYKLIIRCSIAVEKIQAKRADNDPARIWPCNGWWTLYRLTYSSSWDDLQYLCCLSRLVGARWKSSVNVNTERARVERFVVLLEFECFGSWSFNYTPQDSFIRFEKLSLGLQIFFRLIGTTAGGSKEKGKTNLFERAHNCCCWISNRSRLCFVDCRQWLFWYVTFFAARPSLDDPWCVF